MHYVALLKLMENELADKFTRHCPIETTVTQFHQINNASRRR